jgi:hypothetical protein
MLAGLGPKILSSDSSRRRTTASPAVAAAHTDAVAEESDNNTANPGRDRFRAKAEKRPSRVRYKSGNPAGVRNNLMEPFVGREAANVAFKNPLKRTIDP